jgi:uncharacterized protein YeeX (DUF496 family)
MDNQKLIDALKAIGQECFVSYFEYFFDLSCSNHEIASIIQIERKYTHKSCSSRTSKARSIIKNNMTKEALQIIIESVKTDYKIRDKARVLLDNIKQPKVIIPNNSQDIPKRSTVKAITESTSSICFNTHSNAKLNRGIQKKQCHVEYQVLSNTGEMELSIILGKISHHIHPVISNYISEVNLVYQKEFESICHKSCNIESFFYKKSDCVFPGFRRPINKEKTGKWKNNILESDGTILNDNTTPRHIWAYLLVNKAYSGGSAGMWSSSGLAKFELAHIFGHKQDERELESKVFRSFIDKPEPHGLFTSASNVVLIPKGFAKPTDHMQSIKICFYKRHLDLYGNNIIGIDDFNESLVPSWYSDIKWLEPLLLDNWKEKIDNLLEYRKNFLQNKYSNNSSLQL